MFSSCLCVFFFLRRLRWHVARFIYGSYTVRQIFTNCDLSFVLSASPWPWNLGTCERTGARFSSPQFLRTSLKPTCDVALVHKNHKKRSKQEKSSRHLRRLSCSAKEKHVDLGLHNCFSGAIFVDVPLPQFHSSDSRHFLQQDGSNSKVLKHRHVLAFV